MKITISKAYNLIQDERNGAYYLIHNCDYQYTQDFPYCYVAGFKNEDKRKFSYHTKPAVMCNKANRISEKTIEKFFFIAKSL